MQCSEWVPSEWESMDALQWMGAVRMRVNGCAAVNGCRQNESQWMLCSEWVPSEWESDKNSTPVHQLSLEVDWLICIFFINRHRPNVLQIRPINIQARLQAIRDAASCGKQIALPLAQWITLWRQNDYSTTQIFVDNVCKVQFYTVYFTVLLCKCLQYFFYKIILATTPAKIIL